MHISEGVLSGPVLLSGAALAAAGTAIGLKKLEEENRKLKEVILSQSMTIARLKKEMNLD